MAKNFNKPNLLFFTLFTLFSQIKSDPTPSPWPEQFHSIYFMNSSGSLAVVDLWYDWTNGRNFNIIQNQLGELLYDLEWNNGTSFLYTLDSNRKCRILHFEVGVLRPNWLEGANYLGQERVDGFLCNVWEKVDFIWYYEDVVTKRPVHWDFYTGMSAHLITFEVGAALEDAKWQAPVYCFDENKKLENNPNNLSVISHVPHVKSLRMSAHLITFEVGAALEDAKWQAPVYCFDENKKLENNPNTLSVISHVPHVKSLSELLLLGS